MTYRPTGVMWHSQSAKHDTHWGLEGTMPHKNSEDRRAYAKAYYQAHKQHANKVNRAWRTEHHDQFRAQRRRWYAEHKEQHLAVTSRNARARWETDPLVSIAGERVRLSSLPDDLRQVAQLIKEARRLIRQQSRGASK